MHIFFTFCLITFVKCRLPQFVENPAIMNMIRAQMNSKDNVRRDKRQQFFNNNDNNNINSNNNDNNNLNVLQLCRGDQVQQGVGGRFDSIVRHSS